MGAKQPVGIRPGRQGTKELGRLLSESREKAGIGKADLAKMLGRNRSMVTLWENGHAPITNDETITMIANTLNIDKDEIYAAGDYVPQDIWLSLCELTADELGRVRQFVSEILAER